MDKNSNGLAQFLIILAGALVIILAIGFFAFKNGCIRFSPQAINSPTPIIKLSESVNQLPDDNITNWKIYTNDKVPFTFKYPQNYRFKEYLFGSDGGNILFFLEGTEPIESGGETSGNEVMTINIDSQENRSLTSLMDYYQESFSFDKNYSINETEVNGKLGFFLLQGDEAQRIIIKDSSSTSIEVILSKEVRDKIDQILSTFKFTD